MSHDKVEHSNELFNKQILDHLASLDGIKKVWRNSIELKKKTLAKSKLHFQSLENLSSSQSLPSQRLIQRSMPYMYQ